MARTVGFTRNCKKTGLALVNPAGAPAWRIAKTSYGPMNPPLREVSGDRRAWGVMTRQGTGQSIAGDRQHMQPGQLASGWRQERLIHDVMLPEEGWSVDVERAQSITAIAAAMPAYLIGHNVEQLTIGHLRSDDRPLTTGVADWIHSQILDDGTMPHGIYFGSKHDRK